METKNKHETCTKVSFGNEKFANEHITRLQKKSNRDNVPVRAYKCDKCGLWHLTSHYKFTQEQYFEFIETIRLLKESNQALQVKNQLLTKELKVCYTAINSKDKQISTLKRNR